jgi:hypothetical protein
MGDLSHGNVNLFILFLVMAALYTLFRGHKFTSGLILGLAIACKVTPALFLPYFLWKRAWGTLVGCAAGLCLFLGPVPAFYLGWEENKQQLHNWAANMVVPYVMEGVVTSPHQNQSLPGLIHRLTTNSPSFINYDDEHPDAPPALRFHNLLTLDPAIARWIVKGAMLVFVGLVIWSCRTPLIGNGGWPLAAEFSLIVLGMLLFSERTWKHHCVTLVLPFAVLSYFLATCRPGPWLRAYLIGSLALTVLLMTTTSTSLMDALGGESAKMAQVYGAYVWAYLVLMAALVVLLRRTLVDMEEPQPRKSQNILVKSTSLRLGGRVPRFLEVWPGPRTAPQ